MDDSRNALLDKAVFVFTLIFFRELCEPQKLRSSNCFAPPHPPLLRPCLAVQLSCYNTGAYHCPRTVRAPSAGPRLPARRPQPAAAARRPPCAARRPPCAARRAPCMLPQRFIGPSTSWSYSGRSYSGSPDAP